MSEAMKSANPRGDKAGAAQTRIDCADRGIEGDSERFKVLLGRLDLFWLGALGEFVKVAESTDGNSAATDETVEPRACDY
jgi:hypothetical protein